MYIMWIMRSLSDNYRKRGGEGDGEGLLLTGHCMDGDVAWHGW